MPNLRIEDLEPELRQQWAAGRVWAAHQAPYLASALLALAPVVVDCSEDPDAADLSAFPADRTWHVYIDPAVLSEVSVEELGFWLLHQVSHLLRDHGARYPGSSAPERGIHAPRTRSTAHARWNLATDAEINDDLHTDKLTLPGGATTPTSLGLPDGWLAEQYWNELGGDDDDPSRAKRDPDRAAREPGDERDSGSAGHHTGSTGHDCGSAGDGHERAWEGDQVGLGAVACALLKRDTARKIREHREARGEVPAGWLRWMEEILEPSVNWRRELAAQVRRGTADINGRVDFSYRRPSRRSSAVPDVVLPSLRQPLPQVTLVIDTSGSMSDAMLAQALSEVTGVLRSLGVGRRNLKVIACDAQAHEAQSVRSLATITLQGGGGTDMGAGLAAAAELRPRPDLVVVLTDGGPPRHPTGSG
jgi:predicted metal-dependent peptidase